jgi:hypothetical protein
MRHFFVFASLCLVCALGITSRSYAQSVDPSMANHGIATASWGFQCMLDSNCGANGSWITTTSQPGMVRLWSSGTSWALLNTDRGTYDWKTLDTWLDLIVEHQPRKTIYTFGQVPCWIASGTCTHHGWGSGESWSPTPPSDLTSNGSPSFTAFVRELVTHCSPAGHCVKNRIKYWEMWNEASNIPQWTGTQKQLYEMFKPVIPIIRDQVPGAIVSTPPISGGNTTWMASWLALENNNGRLSDYYGFHVYLLDVPPETRIRMVERMVAAKNNAAGWTNTPWMNSETNFQNVGVYSCSTLYSRADCQGQIVRWHVLQYALQAGGGGGGGAFFIGWFDWDNSISDGGYDTYYYTMMQWLTGGTFTAPCANKGTVYTCPLKEPSGTLALIVWNAAGDSDYKPATEYVDYKYFNDTYGGATKSISPGQATRIGVQPVMFESTK